MININYCFDVNSKVRNRLIKMKSLINNGLVLINIMFLKITYIIRKLSCLSKYFKCLGQNIKWKCIIKKKCSIKITKIEMVKVCSKSFEGTMKNEEVYLVVELWIFSFKFVLINVFIFIYILPYSKTNLRQLLTLKLFKY